MKARYLLGLVTLSTLALGTAQMAVAAEAQLPPSVTVTGTGRVFSRPDMAEVNVGVVSQAPTATAALTANNAAMNNLMALLKSNGIEDKDILTSNFSVNPVYSDQPQSSSVPRPPKIVAYRVDNTVQAKIRKIGTLGAILDAVVRGGANSINGISFSIAQPEPVEDRARTNAIADAKRKAEIYASAAGIKLGRVLYITENIDRGIPIPAYRMAKVAMDAAESAPIAAGEQEISATVQVVYAIEP